MAITDWPEQERPREKLLARSASFLSDAELLAIFLRTGMKGLSAVDLAQHLLVEFGGLRAIIEADSDSFCRHAGLGMAKYIQLQAVMELSQRYLAESLRQGVAMSRPDDTRRYLQTRLAGFEQEVFACLYLDSQNRLLRYQAHFFGTIDRASVYPRELVKMALQENAAAVILAHNHPSGVAEPSQADRQITERIISALGLVDIRVLDHFVVSRGQAVSFAERGWI